jgi:tRNA-splicing ligase RtcB
METTSLVRKSENEWWIPPIGRMRVPGVIYASEPLIRDMDEKVREQVSRQC